MSETQSHLTSSDILILGANGRLGSILRIFKSSFQDLNILFQCRAHSNYELGWSGDWADPRIDRMLEGLKPDGTVINLIGATPGPTVVQSEMERINCDFAAALLAKCAEHRIHHVILASSASVYGMPPSPDHRLQEQERGAPISDYGASKVQMEQAAFRFSQTDAETRVTIARIGNVAGADQITQNALAGTRENPMKLHRFADGHGPLRSYLGPKDLTIQIAKLAASPPEGIRTVNLALREPVYAEDLIRSLEGVAGRKIHWEWVPAPQTSAPSVILDTGKMDEIYRIDPDKEISDYIAGQLPLIWAQS